MKMLKSKHFRRLAVFLAMIAPAVYLFGSLFNALAGAHGTEVFAEPVYLQQFVSVDDYGGGDVSDYRVKVDVGDGLDFQSYILSRISGTWGNVYCNFSYEEHACTRFYVYTNQELVIFQNRDNNDGYSLQLVNSGAARFEPWYFYPLALDDLDILWNNGQFGLERIASVPSSEVPENAGAYSDYVFKNFFAKDNFLVEWGRDAISESPHGFAPFGAFWRYLDVNVLHLSDQQIGLMGYGYLYYACHVLLFDVGFVLVTFFLDFIQRIADKFTGGE